MSLDYRNLSDRELIDLLKSSDELAFSQLYDRYLPKMFVIAGNRLGNPEEAEECVQDVMYNIWRQRGTFSLQHDTMAMYLAVAVRNQTFKIMDRNHRRRQRAAGYQPAETVGPTAEEEFLAKELAQRIDQAIRALPDQCRLVFTLNVEQGLNSKQIADHLNIAENTVKQHLKKARRDIRGKLPLVGPLLLQLLFGTYR